VFYDLKKQQETRTLELPISPRHVVLDTTGAKIGISDDVDGGFVLIHAYSRSVQFALEDFPATADVLFDPNDVDIYYSNDATLMNRDSYCHRRVAALMVAIFTLPT